MKRFLLFFALITVSAITFAQDYSKVQLNYMQGKIEDAKKEVDALAANPKAQNKAETYLWKLRVYSEIYADSTLYPKYPNSDEIAIEAFNKYKEAEPSLKLLKEDGVRGLALLYNSSFMYGRDKFRDTSWADAFKYFKLAEEMGRFINDNGLSQNKIDIDTVTVLYTAYAAQNAKLFNDAATYYKQIADRKISGQDYEDVYRFLLDYYSREGQTDNFNNLLVIAKDLYPNSNALWTQMEMNQLTANTGLKEILTKYNDEVKQGTMDEDKYLNYAETFATATKEQLDALDSTTQVEIKLAAADAFKQAFEKNPTNGLYAYNTGVINYNIFGTLDERYLGYRGESAALKAKRAEIEKEQMKYADEAAIWLVKAYDILKAKTDRNRNENNSLNRAVDFLANIYYWKRDKSKTSSNTKDYDKYDAEYKKYDAEHNKYQN